MILTAQCEQHKTELPCLRQIQTSAQRNTFTGTTQSSEGRNESKFKNNGHREQEQDKRPSIPNNAPVKHHANGDEEQAKQDIVKRLDV